ncbi:hypothetical protein Droror1_Dr00003950 [Drosera rotundifolia]
MPNTPKSSKLSRKMAATNGLFYPIAGLASLVAFVFLSFVDVREFFYKEPSLSFVERNGVQFVLDGRPFYVNGWNSYWLMDNAVEDHSRPRVRAMLQAGSKMGLTVCRTWAFNDGSSYHALQISPGQFDEKVFKALDYVVAEARRSGVRLILSLVNNLQAYGGKTQYVKWAWQEGIGISSSNDSFFFDPSIRAYFKDYVKAVLTRKNTITGIKYKDDAAIFAWELINEPHCMSDPSGDTLQDWIKDISAFIKSVDEKHLVTVGLEGFYGPKSPKSNTNPSASAYEATLGTDFIRDSQFPTIDFASVHIYPDHWLVTDKVEDKLEFVKKWMLTHVEDGDTELKKPIMFTEYGLSNQNKGFDLSQRDQLIQTVDDVIYKSAKRGQSGAGSMIWQLMVGGMDEYNDDFGFVPWERRPTLALITKQSCRLALIHGRSQLSPSIKELCAHRR